MKDEKDKQERRKYLRVTLEKIALEFYRKKDFPAPPLLKGYITDLSLGGIRLETEVSMEEGDDLILKVDFLDGPTFSFEGKIAWCLKEIYIYVYGVKFKNIGFFNRIKLKKYLSKTSKT